MLYKEITSEIICLGQILLDTIIRRGSQEAEEGRVNIAEEISLNPGGDALNEGTVLARLGHQVRLVGALGQDYAGQLLLNLIRENGISDEGITVDEKITTPVAALMVKADGHRESTNSRATLLEGYYPDPALIHHARILSLASLFRAPLDQPEKVAALIRQGKKEGMIICADTKLPTFSSMTLDDLSDVLPLIDYIFPNENEARWMTGASDYYEMAERLLARGIQHVVVKAGEKGCYGLSAQGDRFHLDAYPVTAIDATGAGDNFVGGFCSALLRGESFRDCCRYGSACAAVCVQTQGAVGKTMSQEKVVEFLALNP